MGDIFFFFLLTPCIILSLLAILCLIIECVGSVNNDASNNGFLCPRYTINLHMIDNPF